MCIRDRKHVCEQLAQGRYLTAARPGVELATSRVASQRLNHYTIRPHIHHQATHVYVRNVLYHSSLMINHIIRLRFVSN